MDRARPDSASKYHALLFKVHQSTYAAVWYLRNCLAYRYAAYCCAGHSVGHPRTAKSSPRRSHVGPVSDPMRHLAASGRTRFAATQGKRESAVRTRAASIAARSSCVQMVRIRGMTYPSAPDGSCSRHSPPIRALRCAYGGSTLVA
jgi:hypothetical protein